MPLPSLDRLSSGVPLPQWSRVPPERTETYFKFLLVAHMQLTRALATLIAPVDPEPDPDPYGLKYRGLFAASPDKQHYLEILGQYNARRDRLLANLSTVEQRLSVALGSEYERELLKLLA